MSHLEIVEIGEEFPLVVGFSVVFEVLPVVSEVFAEVAVLFAVAVGD
jgi:hypothetical protein